MQAKEMQGVAIRTGGFQHPLRAEQVNVPAETIGLLPNLGAGGLGAKRATTAGNFHGAPP